MTTISPAIWKKHIAIPQEHGSWVFLLSPLLIGLFAGGRWTPASGFLLLTALSVFMFRHPLIIAVKIISGRRPRRELPAAFFWMAVYGMAGLAGIAGLGWQGYASLAVLAVPALLVLFWHLFLVSRRAERRQIGVEIVASGALALAAPAAFWIGVGKNLPLGWWLWLLAWLQSAASIVFAALRLEQRSWNSPPPLGERLSAARRPLLYATFNLVAALALGLAGTIPAGVGIPFALQWVETLTGSLRPAIGLRPTQIGIRQLMVSTLFTLLFIVFWKI